MFNNIDEADKYRFEHMVASSKMVLESPKPRKKSPELLKILEACQAELDNKQYDEMVKDLRKSPSRMTMAGDQKEDMKEIVGMLSAITNVIFSMIAVFVTVFYVGNTVTRDTGMKTLLALFGALIVGIAEGWFFSRDWLFHDIPKEPSRVIDKVPPSPKRRIPPQTTNEKENTQKRLRKKPSTRKME
ncbi:hypothetical protein HDV05_008452 [Chytridiales sp. JEL 0842]|nr:hypothetical protein HDV05_008452 [Chytridiales sp. JEL 0842]